jgi:hypothetical protein
MNPRSPLQLLGRNDAADGSGGDTVDDDEGMNADEDETLYYSFQSGPHATFFVLDTRSYRQGGGGTNLTLETTSVGSCEPAAADIDAHPGSGSGRPIGTLSPHPHSMLGEAQGIALRRWLQESQDAGIAFKFLSSPQPWSRNAPPHGEHCTEGWAGHPIERDALLDWIAEAQITGVVFLSGDLHQCGVFELRPGLIEVTASPVDASGQLTDHAPGAMDHTFYSQHGYNQAFAVVTVPGGGGDSGSELQLRVDIYQGGTTIIYELAETVLIVCVCLLLLVVAPLVHLTKPDGLMGCWRASKIHSACWLLAPLAAVGAVVAAAPSGAEFAEPRYSFLLSEAGELLEL